MPDLPLSTIDGIPPALDAMTPLPTAAISRSNPPNSSWRDGITTNEAALIARQISVLADEFNLFIIEDASHSHGSTWKNTYAGTIGDVGCFSFQQGKVLTCGEGGAVLCAREEIYNKLLEIRTNSRLYREQGECIMDHMHLFESGKILGTNYCIS